MRPTDTKLVIRDGSIYVLSLLESGGIDYAFEYRSVARDMTCSGSTCRQRLISVHRIVHAEYRNVRVILGIPEIQCNWKRPHGSADCLCDYRTESAPHPELAREFSDMVISMAKYRGKRMAGPVVMITGTTVLPEKSRLDQ